MDVMGRIYGLYAVVVVLVATADAVNEGAIRLLQGRTKSSGRVEIYHQRQWGTICDDYFDTIEAEVICRQLGYRHTKAVVLPTATVTPGYSRGTIWLTQLHCFGHETRLTECGHHAWGLHRCTHIEDAGVECDAAAVFDGMHLIGMADWNGRIEIRYGTFWLPICATGFGRAEAMVACRSLGFNVNSAIVTRVFGRSYTTAGGIINVNCLGNETSLDQCAFLGPYIASTNLCSVTSLHAGIKCIDVQNTTLSNMKARINGGSASSGRLEISLNGMWGTVCSRGFRETEASVACRMVGLPAGNAIAYKYAVTHRVLETVEMWLSNVTCNGSESSLLDCEHSGLTRQTCYSYPTEGVGIYCRAADSAHGPHHHHSIRLAGPTVTPTHSPFNFTQYPIRHTRATGSNSGRIEVEYLGIWGTVCEDRWTQTNTNVACRSLGLFYERARKVSLRPYGKGSGPTWLDNVVCAGEELSLFDCQHNVFGREDCSRNEDVAIVCEW